MSRRLPLLAPAVLLATLVAIQGMAVAPFVTPSFSTFTAPAGKGDDAGEPSVGVNWNSHNVMYQSGTQTFRISFANATLPVTATWALTGATTTSITTLDPILFTDAVTGRTFVSQLYGACSLMAFTDNDGVSWTQNPLGCGAGAAFDHQTVGGGAYASPLTALSTVSSTTGGTPYPHSVYYCAQASAEAACALSVDGGYTFNPAIPMYSLLGCGGLHGHLRVAPDGTVFVPNQDCGSGQQGFAVSTTNGLSWGVKTVSGTSNLFKSDPSVAVGSGGKAYFCFQDGDGHPKATTTTNNGTSWSTVVDLGTAFSIKNSEFPAVIAGDNDRAACAWLGTATSGDDQSSSFGGTWHLYVSFTYDGGATWTTVDATPTNAVQIGCIEMVGSSGAGTCTHRNLLDFMDISVDSDGRVYVAFADGCVGSCSTAAASTSAKASIVRQDGATSGLFAAKTLGN